jgi:hypothetical protein
MSSTRSLWSGLTQETVLFSVLAVAIVLFQN